MEAFLHKEKLELKIAELADIAVKKEKDDDGTMVLCVLERLANGNVAQSREQAHAYAKQFRDSGNKYFTSKTGKDIPKAIHMYRKALDAIALGSANDAELASRLESNLSASLFEENRFIE